MSDLAAADLMEEAMGYLDGSLSSTPLEKMIESDIESNDMESLWFHCMEARDMLNV